MVAHQKTDGPTSIEQVRQMLVCGGGMHDFDFAQVVHEVTKANPKAGGQDYVRLVAEAAIKQFVSGMGCC
jgi:hypothetical protein